MTDGQAVTVGLVFQVSVALSGLLLVFVGFVFARGEGHQTRRGDRFRHVGRAGFIPFLLAMLSAWFSLGCLLSGDLGTFQAAVLTLRIGMIATTLYAAVVLFMYM